MTWCVGTILTGQFCLLTDNLYCVPGIFKALLDSSKEILSRVWAIGSPFDSKDILKARGYRWSDGINSSYKAWNKIISGDLEQAELHYLAEEIYPDGDISAVKIVRSDAFSRYSVREG